jgi:hypothetical protein
MRRGARWRDTVRGEAHSRPHRRCWTSRSNLGEWWPSRLVATAAKERLNNRRNPHTLFAAASDCPIAIYEYTPSPPNCHWRSSSIPPLRFSEPGTSCKQLSSCSVAVARISSFLRLEDTAAPCGRCDAARRDRRCPIPCVFFQSLRAILMGSMPACLHHARSSRE